MPRKEDCVFKSKNYWVKIGKRKDKEEYFDIMIEKKGKNHIFITE